MKIKSIEAFAITNPIAGGIYDEGKDKVTARRPPWTKDAEVANPMSRYPRYKALRSSWNNAFPAVGVIVTADDGSWGFGVTGYGQPTISLINCSVETPAISRVSIVLPSRSTVTRSAIAGSSSSR